MFWRNFHRFVIWFPPATLTAYGAVLGVAASAAGQNHKAKLFLDGQIDLLEHVVSAQLFPLWLTLCIAVWLALFFWSAHKTEPEVRFARDRSELATPSDGIGVRNAGDGSPATAFDSDAAAKVRNLISLADGLAYAVSRNWSRPMSDLTETDSIVSFNSQAKEFEQLASVKALSVWGTRHRNQGVHERLEPGVWREQQIERASIYRRDVETEYSVIQSSYEHPRFYRLMVNKDEVERLFPAPWPDSALAWLIRKMWSGLASLKAKIRRGWQPVRSISDDEFTSEEHLSPKRAATSANIAEPDHAAKGRIEWPYRSQHEHDGKETRELESFLELARAWQLSTTEQASLLGVSMSTLQSWRLSESKAKKVPPSVLARIFVAKAVDSALDDCFPRRTDAQAWLRKPLLAADHRAPIDLLTSGRQSDLDWLLRFLDEARGSLA